MYLPNIMITKSNIITHSFRISTHIRFKFFERVIIIEKKESFEVYCLELILFRIGPEMNVVNLAKGQGYFISSEF